MRGNKHKPVNMREVWRCQPCLEGKHTKCQHTNKGITCFCQIKGHLNGKVDLR